MYIKSIWVWAITCLGIIAISAQNLPPQKNTKHNNHVSDKVLNKVNALPEAQAFIKKHKHGAILLYAYPHKNFKYYWVKLGEDMPTHFATAENFYVDPSTYQVFYADPQFIDKNNAITLQLWRKWRDSPKFIQEHHFKKGQLVTD